MLRFLQCLLGVVVSLCAATAAAQITASVDPFETGQGYVSQKLVVETESDWTIGNLLIELASGTIFYENNLPGGGMLPFVTNLGMVGDDTTHRIGGADLGIPRPSPVVTDPQRLSPTATPAATTSVVSPSHGFRFLTVPRGASGSRR